MGKFKPIRWSKRFASLLAPYLHNKWLRLTGRLPKVKWVTWEITDACNSRCQLCDIWKQKPSADMLTLDEVKKVFSDPLLKDLEMVLITGGEAAMRQDLLDIILFIHNKAPKAKFTISTNALLPDRVLKVTEAALDAGADIFVGISLDGIGAHHDEIRGVKGNYEKADYLLNKLLEMKKRYCERLGITIGQTIHPLTLNYIEEVEKYAKDKGVEYLAQLYDEAPYYHNIGKSNIKDAETERMIALIGKMEPSFHNEVVMKILREKMIRFECYSMRSFFILKANGDVMPCLRLCGIKIGNVREHSPSAIWTGPEAEKARKLIADCKGCSNTWATDWSMQSSFLSFFPQLWSSFIKARTGRK